MTAAQHQRITQEHDLPPSVVVDDSEALHPAGPVVDVQITRIDDHVFEPIEQDLDNIFGRVVCQAHHGQPTSLEVRANLQRGDLDCGALAGQSQRHPVAETAPLPFFELV